MFKKIIATICFILPSSPTQFLFRICGWKIGRNVRLPILTYIYADEITIGNDACIRRLVYINVRRLSIGANTIISYGTQIKGPASFRCGDNAFFGIHCIVHCAENVTLGFYSGLGPKCTVYTHGSFLPVTMGYPAKFAPVVIEDFVWIAMSVTIMPGAHIERNCIVNPGVVIQGRIHSDSIVQVDPDHSVVHDLARLQKISRKGPAYYHKKIISSFLISRDVDFRHEPGSSVWTLAEGRTFLSMPETNCLELHLRDKEKVVYDLEAFWADPSTDSLHRGFLIHIRLHFGLTLRTRYR